MILNTPDPREGDTVYLCDQRRPYVVDARQGDWVDIHAARESSGVRGRVHLNTLELS